MCVIIERPTGVTFPDENFRACWGRNGDGWGIMFPDEGRVKVIRSMKNDEFLEVYHRLGDRPMGIHFRLKTHGAVNHDNLHPFPILTKEDHGRDLWMMHNGTIDIAQPYSERKHDLSDTWHFAEYIRPLLAATPGLLDDPIFQTILGKYIGWSRLLFLDGDGKFVSVNKEKGIHAFGCWLSNDYSHRVHTVHPTQASGSNHTSHSQGWTNTPTTSTKYNNHREPITNSRKYEKGGREKPGATFRPVPYAFDACHYYGGPVTGGKWPYPEVHPVESGLENSPSGSHEARPSQDSEKEKTNSRNAVILSPEEERDLRMIEEARAQDDAWRREDDEALKRTFSERSIMSAKGLVVEKITRGQEVELDDLALLTSKEIEDIVWEFSEAIPSNILRELEGRYTRSLHSMSDKEVADVTA